MRLLHTSDWHLGASDGDRFLFEDQKCFIDEICDIADKENIDVVIIAGDVYDRSVASAEAIGLYDYAMTKLCATMNKEVIVIAGNHDSAARLSGCRELLESAGLHVLGSAEYKAHIISYEDADIYMLPWITEEKIKGLYKDAKDDINCLTDAYRVVCKAYKDTFVPNKKHILVAHAFIANSETSGSDRAAAIAAVGSASCVSADVFEGFDYVALGHIHGAQNINNHIRYSGTPMAYSFGREEKQTKSVTIIDTATMDVSEIALHPLYRRTTLIGTLDELLKGDVQDDIKNGYVRLMVTDSYVGLETISALREIYPHFLEIQGKSFEGEDSKIRMSIDEFKAMESDPNAIFLSFCKDIINDEPDEHLIKMFGECVALSDEEVVK